MESATTTVSRGVGTAVVSVAVEPSGAGALPGRARASEPVHALASAKKPATLQAVRQRKIESGLAYETEGLLHVSRRWVLGVTPSELSDVVRGFEQTRDVA